VIKDDDAPAANENVHISVIDDAGQHEHDPHDHEIPSHGHTNSDADSVVEIADPFSRKHMESSELARSPPVQFSAYYLVTVALATEYVMTILVLYVVVEHGYDPWMLGVFYGVGWVAGNVVNRLCYPVMLSRYLLTRLALVFCAA
jgi:hypothetical protein